MPSTAGIIRKRPVVTYSKRSRQCVDRRGQDEDQRPSKRIRLSPPRDEEGDNTIDISQEITDTATSDSTSDITIDDSFTSSPVTTPEQQQQSTKPTKPTSFTLSTRRKPLFKRNTPKSNDSSSFYYTSASESSISPPSKPSLASLQQKQQKLVQMQIDLDGIGAPKVSCKECGMQYVPSAAEDAKLHKRYHAQIVEGLEFGTVRAGSVVWEGKLGATVAHTGRNKDSNTTTAAVMNSSGNEKKSTVTPEEKENTTQITRYFTSGRGEKPMGKRLPLGERTTAVSSSGHAKCYVVEITRRSTPSEKKKAVEFLRFANRELSAQEVPEKVLWSSAQSANLSSGEKSVEQFKVYLYIEGTKCIGLCLAEKIKEAQWAGVAEDRANESGSISCSLDVSPTKQPALLGISRIWTSPKHRRHGVASRLVGSVVDNFVYGMKVETGRVAFSQPTDSGAWFAWKWVDANQKQERESNGGGEDTKVPKKGFLMYFDSV
ncbi:hypothetical protein H072_2503 [Dactylellina haptotyla CBS 200.50]|uniref:N-acetyltransferase ECO1 n=1 Tax=Dactylellina haptotyla (strain CBS 200.50) TaxID=1284197 RepID=S8AKP0_DACHA|nr:hypothetical protein H072_2503 [Dactylellina haptotyla CBS 200.50]